MSIGSNGYLTFGDDGTAYSNDEIPDSASPNALVAPFWDDLNPSDGGTVHYLRDTDNGRLVVQWTDVPYYDTESQNTFQVILEANGTIRYRYREMDPLQEATVGIENDDGTEGLPVAFNTDYVTESLAVRIVTTPPLVVDVRPASGVLSPGASEELTVTPDANRPVGTHSSRLAISTNDPEAASVELPIGLTVEGTQTPADLTATTDSNNVTLNWTASSASNVTRYRIYRTTSPTDFEGGPAALSPVDSVGGSTTQYVEGLDPGRTYYYRVTAASDQGESSFSPQADAFLYPAQVRASADRSFGAAADATDYRLVALPGDVDRWLSGTLEGEAGVDWQAYLDDGSESDFLLKYDGSDRFTFEPSAGVWVTAVSNWTSQLEASTVDLRGDSAAAIGLRANWNVISNPTDKDVAWSRVNGATAGSLQALWTFDGAFARAGTFRSAQDGIPYYFLNDRADRDSLIIPYPGAPKTTATGSKQGGDTPPRCWR